jgi:HAD superfamily hydrolase (TIGR01509 family)
VKTVAELFASADAVLLDFDGPICSVFAKLPASRGSQAMLEALRQTGCQLDGEYDLSNPHALLQELGRQLPGEFVQLADEALARVEIEAAQSAVPTKGIEKLIGSLQNRPWAVASNNTTNCIQAFFLANNRLPAPTAIAGRPPGRPDLMKPAPYLLLQAADALGVALSHTVLIGDSLADVQAAATAGARVIGYANKPGKIQRLRSAGADWVVTDLSGLLS